MNGSRLTGVDEVGDLEWGSLSHGVKARAAATGNERIKVMEFVLETIFQSSITTRYYLNMFRPLDLYGIRKIHTWIQ